MAADNGGEGMGVNRKSECKGRKTSFWGVERHVWPGTYRRIVRQQGIPL